ncbi:caspase family protein [Paenibacillus sp. FSL L8-0340]|uniref:caspase family protein n=1 Tax=Paenibacillus sp. FSL L8-0340 TaxID=2954685 RepID=UPI00315821A0
MLNKQRKILNKIMGKKNLLAIGVNSYSDTNFGDLKRACGDATAVFETFENVLNLNLNVSNSKLLISDGKKVEATKANILEEIETISKSTSYDENIVIYFSGHGHRINDKNFIVPSDSISATEEELIEIKKIIEIIEKCNCRHKLVIIDACFSGVVDSGRKGIGDYNFKNIKDYMEESRSLTLIASSGKDEPSYEISPNNNQYSLFTTFLIDALEGKTECLINGYLTVQSMYDYIANRVRKVGREDREVRQRPNLSMNSNGEIVLGIYDAMIFKDDSDLDNYSIIQIREEEDLFNKLEKNMKIRISDALWVDTKCAISELIMNGFEHEKSNDININISSNNIVLNIKGNMFDSITMARNANENGLKFVNDYISKYQNDLTIEYQYKNDNNIITFNFGNKHAFFIKGICVVKVECIGFRKYTSKDIIMPIGVCKKYYYYIERQHMAMSQTRSAVSAILENLPKESILIVYDKNVISGSMSFSDYIANERVIYRGFPN